MKFSLAWAALAAGMFQIVATAPLLAQVGGPAGAAGAAKSPVAPKSSGTNVAVVDISLVFEQYPEFQAQMKGLKGEVEQFEAGLRQENEQLRKKAEGIKEFTPSTAEYKTLEGELARLQSEMQVKMALKRKDFLEKEARIYYEAYGKVYDEVAKLAARNDIRLVLRFNSEEMKQDDRNSVLQGVNKAVVYQQNLNITGLVVRSLGGVWPPPAKDSAADLTKKPRPASSLK